MILLNLEIVIEYQLDWLLCKVWKCRASKKEGQDGGYEVLSRVVLEMKES